MGPNMSSCSLFPSHYACWLSWQRYPRCPSTQTTAKATCKYLKLSLMRKCIFNVRPQDKCHFISIFERYEIFALSERQLHKLFCPIPQNKPGQHSLSFVVMHQQYFVELTWIVDKYFQRIVCLSFCLFVGLSGGWKFICVFSALYRSIFAINEY